MRLLAFAVVFGPCVAPTLEGQAPPGWAWQTDGPVQLTATTDRPTDSLLAFVRMPPGWHMTMGPGGVLFDPRYFAEGSYTLESQYFHFPNSSAAEYGLMVGGRDLAGGGARYVAFVARGDGSVAAWERVGGTDRMLAEWRRADAVRATDGKEVVGNLLRLTVSPKEAVFKVNGLDALILPLEGLSLDGQFGFRVGRGMNLHASTLTVTQRLAPGRGQ